MAVYATAWIAGILFFCSRLQLSGVIKHWPASAAIINRLGAVSLWIHIICAYWLAHDGSHQAAVEHVANRTQQAIGIRNGLGIYANYATAIIWSWQAFTSTQVPASGLRKSAEIFLWLMWISASVVFAQPASALVFVLIALFVLWSRSKWQASHS